MIALQLRAPIRTGWTATWKTLSGVVKGRARTPLMYPSSSGARANDEKDAALLRRVAEVCEGKNVAVGPLSEKNYKQIGAMAIGYNQSVHRFIAHRRESGETIEYLLG